MVYFSGSIIYPMINGGPAEVNHWSSIYFFFCAGSFSVFFYACASQFYDAFFFYHKAYSNIFLIVFINKVINILLLSE